MGNLLTIYPIEAGCPTSSYSYDPANGLVGFVDCDRNMEGGYGYDGLGNRYRQTVNGATTSYLLDLNSSLTQVLGEIRPGDDTYYLLGLDVIGQQTGSQWSYFGYDGLGSVRQMTDLTGALTYAASFAPYGSPFEQYAAASTTLGFTGEQTDLNGLLYLRARYYNPALGSFLSLDPVQGVMGSALSFNPYLYVQGNPTNYVDPTGQFAWLALLIPFAKIVGAMIAGAAIGYASSRVVDAGAQLLFTGQIDWGQNAAAGIEGAILGAITGPFGLAAGALSARAVAQGVSRTLVRRAAFAFSLGLDVGVSAAWDTRVRGDGLGASLLSNIAGSVGGEIAGYLLGRARRAVQGSLNSLGSTARNTWQTSGQVAGTVFRAPAGFLLGTGIGGPLPFNRVCQNFGVNDNSIKAKFFHQSE